MVVYIDKCQSQSSLDGILFSVDCFPEMNNDQTPSIQNIFVEKIIF